MAPKRKATPNGFILFTYDWKARHGPNISMGEATAEAGKIWASMTPQQRGPFNERAKLEKNGSKDRALKLTCTGVPVTYVEQERTDAEDKERTMKRVIETTIRNSVKEDELHTRSYYFISVNYFTKTLKGGVYVPAEISLSEFSLKDGVIRKYHCFVNPGVTIYGHQYDAQHHSDTTHKLPLPPNAMGEKDMSKVFNDVLEFIYDDDKEEFPPVYTTKDTIQIVESVLDFLKTDGSKNVTLQVFSIQYLFYIMKNATCEVGDMEQPKSYYITDAQFDRDYFEYQTGIACEYHEEIDKAKYCTQSCVTRWGYTFADYMCSDIAISLIPGRHVPVSTNISAIICERPPQAFGDLNSVCSDNTYNTSRMWEAPVRRDFDAVDSTYDEEFPAILGTRRKAPASVRSKQREHQDPCVDDDDNVPHCSRYSTSAQSITQRSADSSFNSDFKSRITIGRGRGMLSSHLNNDYVPCVGRGRPFL